MPLNTLLLSPTGRVNRQPYILWSLGLTVVGIVLQALAGAFTDSGGGDLGAGQDMGAGQAVFAIVSLLWSLGTIWPSLALAIKRCHDRDRSGWFVLVSLIPIVGAIWAFVELFCLPGTPGRNRFGADPLRPDEQEIEQVFS